MATGGSAEGSDTLFVDAISSRIVPHKANRALSIFNGAGKTKPRSRTVGHNEHGVSRLAKFRDVAREFSRLLQEVRIVRQWSVPAAAWNDHNTIAVRGRRLINIHQQSKA